MAESRLTCDSNSIILLMKLNGEEKQLTFTRDQVAQVLFEKTKEFWLFIPVPSEKIEITVKNRSTPIVITKLKEKAYFEEYKQQLAKFAKENRVTLKDNTL